jgi:hypothetical protein
MRAVLAAVTIPEAARQSRSTVKKCYSVLKEELASHGIKVKRLVPRRVSKRKRRLVAYARARRLKRVYELRLRQGRGEKVVVKLVERRGRRMRRSFSAKLSAAVEEVDAVIPLLVEAVIERRRPRPLPPPQPETVVATATVQAAESPSEEVEQEEQEQPVATVSSEGEAETGGEFLWGFSLEPGAFMRGAAFLFGGSGKLLYQKRNYRFGAEIGGMGGGGTLISFAVRGQYLFRELFSWKDTTPLVGASLGYTMMTNGEGSEGSGISFSASLGAQFTQLSWARVVTELEFLLPFYGAERHDPVNNNGIVDIVEHSTWSPAVILKTSCLF